MATTTKKPAATKDVKKGGAEKENPMRDIKI